MGALDRGLGEEDAVAGDDPHGPAVEMGKTGDEGFAEAGLEFVEPRAVDEAGDELAHLPRRAGVGGDEAEEFLGVVRGRFGGDAGGAPDRAPGGGAECLPDCGG